MKEFKAMMGVDRTRAQIKIRRDGLKQRIKDFEEVINLTSFEVDLTTKVPICSTEQWRD